VAYYSSMPKWSHLVKLFNASISAANPVRSGAGLWLTCLFWESKRYDSETAGMNIRDSIKQRDNCPKPDPTWTCLSIIQHMVNTACPIWISKSHSLSYAISSSSPKFRHRPLHCSRTWPCTDWSVQDAREGIMITWRCPEWPQQRSERTE